MELFLASASILLCLGMVIALYFLIKVLRGNIRQLERERNVHNLQVSQLLDRMAHAEGRPWTLPPREVVEVYKPEDDTELTEHMWREV